MLTTLVAALSLVASAHADVKRVKMRKVGATCLRSGLFYL